MQNKKKATMGTHVGSASIVMVFTVLCLTVFAVLAFTTATYEQRLAEKYALSAQEFYAADGICEEKYQKICTILQREDAFEDKRKALVEMDVRTERMDGAVILYYNEAIDDTQELQVQLRAEENGKVLVEKWKVTATKTWEYDDTITVWDGETSG